MLTLFVETDSPRRERSTLCENERMIVLLRLVGSVQELTGAPRKGVWLWTADGTLPDGSMSVIQK